MKSVLEVTGLRVARGPVEILRGIDWRIAPGEHWVILGANGCGKTSLLKALTGFLSASSGDFSMLGQRYGASDWRALRLKIGVVTSAFAAAIPAAEVALDTVVSGKFAQLDLWARVTSAELAAGRKFLRLVGAAKLAAREWQFLSQGERQRVLIARALMARPRILILDEPCAGLDPIARDNILRLTESLARRRSGPALVLVTHHVEEITPAFTHALLMREGRVVAAGPRATTLTSAKLSATFAAPVLLTKQGPTLRLSVGQ